LTTPGPLVHLQTTRQAFLDWSASLGVSPTDFEDVRCSLVATVWGAEPITPINSDLVRRRTSARPAATNATAVRKPKPVNADRTLTTAVPTPAHTRSAVTAPRSLQQAERLLASAETTRESIPLSYTSVGAPDVSTLLAAQAADTTCQAIRSYLTTGHAGAATGTDSLRLDKWVQREAAFL
jgi:hypothetical protein